jgi:hypothetical protein
VIRRAATPHGYAVRRLPSSPVSVRILGLRGFASRRSPIRSRHAPWLNRAVPETPRLPAAATASATLCESAMQPDGQHPRGADCAYGKDDVTGHDSRHYACRAGIRCKEQRVLLRHAIPSPSRPVERIDLAAAANALRESVESWPCNQLCLPKSHASCALGVRSAVAGLGRSSGQQGQFRHPTPSDDGFQRKFTSVQLELLPWFARTATPSSRETSFSVLLRGFRVVSRSRTTEGVEPRCPSRFARSA